MRSLHLAEGLLEWSGRKTVTGMIRGSGRDQQDWSADYRFFSQARWDTTSLSAALTREVVGLSESSLPVVAAADDTICKKSGFKIPGVSYRRDPMSPPFHVNFIPGQRFLQISMMVPRLADGTPGSARAIPIRFEHVPAVPKLPAKASDEQRTKHRAAVRHNALANHGARLIAQFRSQLDQAGAHQRPLIMATDNSYTNEKVLKHLPERTSLIGRIRKDTKLFFLPQPNSSVGRPRKYGERAPTPEQLQNDDSVPWQRVDVFAAGKLHSFRVKTFQSPLLWEKAGSDRPVRLVVIAPLAYRLRKQGRTLYRRPAFLICTDPQLALDSVVQYYVWRWDIEQNHRDEKQLFGVGQAQVRTLESAKRVPAFVVACYAALLIAAIKTYGHASSIDDLTLPKWQKTPSHKPKRIPSTQLLERVRIGLAHSGPALNFDHFAIHVARFTKQPKSTFSLEEAVDLATH